MSACKFRKPRPTKSRITPQEIDSRLADIARSKQHRPRRLHAAACAGRRFDLDAALADRSRHRLEPSDRRSLRHRACACPRSKFAKRKNASPPTPRRPQYQISEIFLPAENEAEFNEMEQGALRLLQEMQRGAPFPAVARQFSRSPSAVAGGDIGWIASTDLAPELQPVADRLEKPGQVSLPVRTPTGVYIIAMRDRRAGADPGASSTDRRCARSARQPRAKCAVERLQRRAAVAATWTRKSRAFKARLSSTSAKRAKPISRPRFARESTASPPAPRRLSCRRWRYRKHDLRVRPPDRRRRGAGARGNRRPPARAGTGAAVGALSAQPAPRSHDHHAPMRS